LRCQDLVEELGRVKPRTISDMMDISNKWADDEDAVKTREGNHPTRIVIDVIMNACGEADKATRTMIGPIKWWLASPIDMIGEAVTATVDTAGTTEMKQGPGGRCFDPGLGSCGSMIKHQTKSSKDPAIYTFTSTLKEKGRQIISRRIAEPLFSCRGLSALFRATHRTEGSPGCLDSLRFTLLLHHRRTRTQHWRLRRLRPTAVISMMGCPT
jgi:hypothetical protein